MNKFDLVKEYLNDMELVIIEQDNENELVVVENEDEGIKNLIIDCEEPIVIIEQLILRLKPSAPADFFKRLLQMNRELVHGAFVLDETGDMLLFRDTLQLENLDYNELEGSIKALSLAMSEYGSELLKFAAA
ncbi:Putative bacterial sensory transduction regulator [Desulfonema limicola]|uniref:Bacterial sensory transduction regulator n=1 Tax=Desulfonema limicola TaxID=45656 RepID=A0A975B7I5_9BACT|nr:YbjN domain-containing protein [Desulfonema limicola]QTA80241.1 Putative bacterial sensory transduction regulator [Desulfonema limicola]